MGKKSPDDELKELRARVRQLENENIVLKEKEIELNSDTSKQDADLHKKCRIKEDYLKLQNTNFAERAKKFEQLNAELQNKLDALSFEKTSAPENNQMDVQQTHNSDEAQVYDLQCKLDKANQKIEDLEKLVGVFYDEKSAVEIDFAKVRNEFDAANDQILNLRRRLEGIGQQSNGLNTRIPEGNQSNVLGNAQNVEINKKPLNHVNPKFHNQLEMAKQTFNQVIEQLNSAENMLLNHSGSLADQCFRNHDLFKEIGMLSELRDKFVNDLFDQADKAFRAQKLRDAVTLLVKGIGIENTGRKNATKLTDSWMKVTVCHYMMNEHHFALMAANQAIECSPKSADALNARAGCFLALKDYNSAAKDLKAVLALQPNHVQARNALGEIQMRQQMSS